MSKSIPPVPSGVDPELRSFLEAMRAWVLAAGGQTRVARDSDQRMLTVGELREVLPGMVDSILRNRGQ